VFLSIPLLFFGCNELNWEKIGVMAISSCELGFKSSGNTRVNIHSHINAYVTLYSSISIKGTASTIRLATAKKTSAHAKHLSGVF